MSLLNSILLQAEARGAHHVRLLDAKGAIIADRSVNVDPCFNQVDWNTEASRAMWALYDPTTFSTQASPASIDAGLLAIRQLLEAQLRLHLLKAEAKVGEEWVELL